MRTSYKVAMIHWSVIKSAPLIASRQHELHISVLLARLEALCIGP